MSKDKRPLFMVRTAEGLRPANPSDAEQLQRVKAGALVRVDVKRPRNVAQHRLYWAMVTLIASNLDRVQPETLHDLIKLRTGHVHVVRTTKGLVELPGSISFASMSQEAFDAFFQRAIDYVVTDVIPGLSRDDLTREIDAMIGVAPNQKKERSHA